MVDYILVAIVLLLLAFMRARYVYRHRTVDLSNPEVLYETWIAHAAAFENEFKLHRHIVKHANELADEVEKGHNYETWSASMHNLLAIYDVLHGVKPDADLKLERLTVKYLSDPINHVQPPSPLPKRIVEGATGPSIEARRKKVADKQRYSGS